MPESLAQMAVLSSPNGLCTLARVCSCSFHVCLRWLLASIDPSVQCHTGFVTAIGRGGVTLSLALLGV